MTNRFPKKEVERSRKFTWKLILKLFMIYEEEDLGSFIDEEELEEEEPETKEPPEEEEEELEEE